MERDWPDSAPLPPLLRRGQRNCPVCRGALLVEAKAEIAVEVCARHGIWFDHGQLPRIVRRIKARGTRRTAAHEMARSDRTVDVFGGPLWWEWLDLTDWTPPPSLRGIRVRPSAAPPLPNRGPSRLKCPACRQLMVTERMHGVEIDVCLEHGIWLDQGELLTIVTRARLPVAPTRATRFAAAAYRERYRAIYYNSNAWMWWGCLAAR